LHKLEAYPVAENRIHNQFGLRSNIAFVLMCRSATVANSAVRPSGVSQRVVIHVIRFMGYRQKADGIWWEEWPAAHITECSAAGLQCCQLKAMIAWDVHFPLH